MLLRGLLIGLLLFSASSLLHGQLFNDTDIDDGSRFVHPVRHNRPSVEDDFQQVLDPELAKNESIILVSFLAAVSQVSQEIGSLLTKLSESRQTSSGDSSSAFESKHAQTVGNLHECFRMDFDGSMIAGAVKVAVDDINERKDILPNHSLHYIFKNTCGDEQRSTQAFMEHWKLGARVFIGPESNCRTEAQMAAAQNLPIVSYKCRDKVVSDKKKYTTFSRTAPAETDITKAFITMMKQFKWRKFTVIYESTTQANRELMEALRDAVDIENKNVFDTGDFKFQIQNTTELHQFSEIGSDSIIDTIIDQTKKNTRLYVTFGSVRLFRKILQMMGQKGMMDTQEYLLIYLDPDYNWLDVYHAMNNHFVRNTMVNLAASWDDTNSSDSIAVKYLKNAMAIIPTPVDYTSEKFVKFWNRTTQNLNFFGVYRDTGPQWSVRYNRFACYLYDAVMIYAKALHAVINDSEKVVSRGWKGRRILTQTQSIKTTRGGYDPTREGYEITKRIVGSYESICGFKMTINENHDAKGNYTLLSWQSVQNKTDNTSADYYPFNYALDLTGIFIDGPDGIPTITFHRDMVWTDNVVPKDQPECGFNNELCTGATISVTHATVIVILGFTFLAAALGGTCSIRTRKVEKELHSIWKIDPKEVSDHVRHEDDNETMMHLAADKPEGKLGHHTWDRKQLKDTGVYRGSNVWIKEIIFDRKLKELNRKMKIEMRIMRQLNNNNINPFLGIFYRNQSICVVRDYCARGSLMDLLVNKDIKIDDVFITSFVDDMLKGMTYLHESELGVHGNLKSTNCLITTRWVVQMADFGLFELREGRKWTSDRARWDNLLWTAPEALKESQFGLTQYKPTKAADVYSFGVILHELVVRNGPYACMVPNAPAVEEVVKSAAEGCSPHTGHDAVISRPMRDTIKSCFRKASERPDFKYGIRNALRVYFQQAAKKNIMDHMFEVMDLYQNTLEDRVKDKTQELVNEQKRSEILLKRMLPPGVAQQLLSGENCQPEMYPGVTIYFSDIVGFTRISGESEPLQVVRLLNKLYTLFDEIIQQYQVYKVETIGDAYMVVGGVPTFTNRDHHCKEISVMALHLLEAIKNFTIPHRPHEKLLLRIGIHTGCVVGGVVGSAMPRFCLFGDTVNTASRMESNGEPLKIHCSSETSKVLMDINEKEGESKKFLMEYRGELDIKGKGKMQTYWLTGREGLVFEEIPDPPNTEEGLPEDIFPRSTATRAQSKLGSAWALNRPEPTLSMVKDFTFMRKHDKPPAPPPAKVQLDPPIVQDFESVHFSSQNGGNVSVGSSFNQLAAVNEEEPLFGERSRERRRHLLGRHRQREAGDDVVLRKRSTSLPSGEKLNLEGIEFGRKAIDSQSLQSSSPSPSAYPSYRDLHTEVQRKRGMALTVWPSRKRSLSVGDTTAGMLQELEPASQDMTQHLLENKARKGRRVNKERKSVLSLHGLRDSSLARLRDASPFARRRFWGSRTSNFSHSNTKDSSLSMDVVFDRSRGESLNRFLRRFTHTSDYSGLTDSTDGSDERVAEGSNEAFVYNETTDRSKEPLISPAVPPELMV